MEKGVRYSREHINVWKKNFGSIPKDEDGRTYEIHHIDGNVYNNNINNLVCVSIKEHYEIHLQQNDLGAAFLIGRRMKIPPKQLSELSRKNAQKKISEGTHNFQNPNFNRSVTHNKGYVVAYDQEKDSIIRVRKELFDLDDKLIGINNGRKQKHIHNNRYHNKGKKWTQKNKEIGVKCKYCDFIGRGSHISRYHNQRCKKYNES